MVEILEFEKELEKTIGGAIHGCVKISYYDALGNHIVDEILQRPDGSIWVLSRKRNGLVVCREAPCEVYPNRSLYARRIYRFVDTTRC